MYREDSREDSVKTIASGGGGKLFLEQWPHKWTDLLLANVCLCVNMARQVCVCLLQHGFDLTDSKKRDRIDWIG